MIGIGSTVNVDGPYSAQPRLVRIGCITLFTQFMNFGLFIPASLAMACVMGVGTPAPTSQGLAGPLVFCGLMAAVGAWVNCIGLAWFRGGTVTLIARFAFVVGTLLVSAAVAAVAAKLDLWPKMFLCALALVVVGILIGHHFIGIGQATGRRS